MWSHGFKGEAVVPDCICARITTRARGKAAREKYAGHNAIKRRDWSVDWCHEGIEAERQEQPTS